MRYYALQHACQYRLSGLVSTRDTSACVSFYVVYIFLFSLFICSLPTIVYIQKKEIILYFMRNKTTMESNEADTS